MPACFLLSLAQPWARCERCTCWVSRAHVCVCDVCWVIGILEEGRVGCCLCCPGLIMWLITSTCPMQLRPYNPTRHKNTLTERKDFDPERWILQSDGEKKSTNERRVGRGMRSIKRKPRGSALNTPESLPLAPPSCKCSSPFLCSSPFPALYFLILPHL